MEEEIRVFLTTVGFHRELVDELMEESAIENDTIVGGGIIYNFFAHLNLFIHGVPDIRTFITTFATLSDINDPFTHTNLNGGVNSKFDVHDHLYPLFAMALLKDYMSGTYHSFQEPISKDNVIRMFVDLDSDDHDFTDEEIMIIAQNFKNEYMTVHSVQREPEIYWIRNISSRKKVHIYFRFAVTSKKILKYIAERVHTNLPLWSKYIDNTYSGCRVVLCGKKDNYNSRYETSNEFTSSNLYSRMVHMFKLIIETRVRAFEWEVVPPLNPMFRTAIYPPDENRIAFQQGEDNVSTEIRTKMLQHIDSLNLRRNFTVIPSQRGYDLRRIRSSMCSICRTTHEHDHMMVIIRSRHIVLVCWRDPTKSHKFEELRRMTPEEKAAMRNKTKKTLARKQIFLPPWYVDVNRYSSRNLPHNLDINLRTQIIWSPMASGKTDKISQLLKQNPTLSALYIVSRRSLAKSSETRFKEPNNTQNNTQNNRQENVEGNNRQEDIVGNNTVRDEVGNLESDEEYAERVRNTEVDFAQRGLRFINYLDDKSKEMIANVQYYICSPESIHVLANRYFDILIIDECTTFMQQMNSPYHREWLTDNQLVVEDLVTNITNVICLDADIDSRICTFLYHFRKTRIYMEHNTFKNRSDYRAIAYDDEKLIVNLEKDLTDGLNIVLVTSSLEKGRKYEELAKRLGISYAFYHQYSGEARLNELENVNVSWIQYQLVIYTSVVQSGTSFTKRHFHKLYMYCSSQSTFVRNMKQMSMRVRELLMREVCYTIHARFDNVPITVKHIRKEREALIAKGNETVLIEIPAAQRERILNGKFHVWKIKNTIWTWLYFENMKEINLSRRHYGELFELMMEDQGYQMVKGEDASEEEKEQVKEWKQEVAIIIKNEKAVAFNMAPIITLNELTALKNNISNNKARTEDHMTVRKNDLLNEIEPENRGQITGDDWVEVENCQKQLRNARIERDFSKLEVIYKEINDKRKKTKTVDDEPFLNKFALIKLLCTFLGVSSTLDRETIISSQIIRNDLIRVNSFWKTNIAAFRSVFGIRSKATKIDLKSIKHVMDLTIWSWSVCKLKTQNEDRGVIREEARERVYEWKLVRNESFDKILSLMIILSRPHIPHLRELHMTSEELEVLDHAIEIRFLRGELTEEEQRQLSQGPIIINQHHLIN